jgi:predicted TIM-barrel fold metal-dependent hydrolase
MSAARLVDVNAAIGPWPHGDAPELDVRSLVAQLDRFGIEQALVYHSTAWMYDPAVGNERLLRDIADEPRLLPCFVLGPLETGEFGEPGTLPGALADAGVRGIRVYPRDHGWTLAGVESELLFRTVAQARLPVFVDLVQTDWGSVSTLLTREPELRLVVCSVGYRGLRVLLPLFERHSNLACDLSYFAAHQGVEVVVRRFGAERLLFGTGMPVCEPAGAVACLAWADLDDVSRAAIGAGNAERRLGLEAAAPARTAPVGVTVAEAALDTMLEGRPLAELDVFDVHGHLGAWLAFWLPKQGVEPIVAQMDRCGVDAIAVSSLPAVGPDPNGNEETLAAAAASEGRIFAYVVANPHRPDLEARVERQLRLPGVVGLKVHPDTHSCPADDPAYDWVWQLAERTESVVLAHTFAGTPWSDPHRFDSVAERFPSVRVILAHAGVTPDGFRRSIEVCGRHSQLVVDTSGSYMTGHWTRRLVEEIGPDRVLYGSDTPFIDLRYGLGRVIGAGLDDDTLRRVLGGNARTLLAIHAASAHTTLQGG